MSYFIQCVHCGFQNEIQSEYLTFCGNCKKKLPVNFREWQKNNPEKSFEDFKQSVGKNSAAEPNEEVIHSSRSMPKYLYLKVGIVFILLCVGTFVLFPKLITDSQLVLYVQSIIEDKTNELKWQNKTYGDFGLQFDSPVELKEIKVKFPPDLAPLMLDIQIFASDFNNNIAIMAISNKFRANSVDVSLESSVTRFIDQLRSMSGIGDFIIQQDETSLSGFDGFKQTGQFTRSGQLKKFESIGVGEGQMLWQIMIVYNVHDEELEQAKDRIINSVKILYNRSI